MSHSHLPPRPEFENPVPSRYPPTDRYGRPIPPPSDRYRDPRDPYPPRSPPRGRGDVYVPRSPPRSNPRSPAPYGREPPPRVAYPPRSPLPPRDAYPLPRDLSPRDLPPPVRDPYYSRREDDRYYRDWQRRDLPDYRSRAPPPPAPSRGYGREPADWRDRNSDRGRRWEDDRRRSYEWDRRERSPIRDRDRGYPPRPREDDRPIPRERPRDIESERRWIPRQSRSPPRRMAPSSVGSVSRGRSPTPPRLRESPTRSYARPSPPSPRSPPPKDSSRNTSPGVLRLGNHSIDVTSRFPRQDIRSPMSRDRSPSRFNSHSPSKPIPVSQPITEQSRDAEIKREEITQTPLSPVSAKDTHPPRSPTPIKQDLPAPAPARTPSQAEDGQLPESTEVKPVPEISLPPTTSSPLAPQFQQSPSRGLPLPPRRRSRSPPPLTQTRQYARSPTVPSSPQVHSPAQSLSVKQEWSTKASPRSISTPKAEATPAPVHAVHPHIPVIPRYTKPHNPSQDIENEISRIETQRARLKTEHNGMAKATARALHELEMSSQDLKLAEQRRTIADSQLEKARAGVLGVDYSA